MLLSIVDMIKSCFGLLAWKQAYESDLILNRLDRTVLDWVTSFRTWNDEQWEWTSLLKIRSHNQTLNRLISCSYRTEHAGRQKQFLRNVQLVKWCWILIYGSLKCFKRVHRTLIHTLVVSSSTHNSPRSLSFVFRVVFCFIEFLYIFIYKQIVVFFAFKLNF